MGNGGENASENGRKPTDQNYIRIHVSIKGNYEVVLEEVKKDAEETGSTAWMTHNRT